MAKLKKEKPRCKNCGDETNFSGENAHPERLKMEWCVPCFKQHEKKVEFERPLLDGRTEFWKDDREIYRKTPYDGRPPRG